MKKLVFAVVIACMTFFTSCGVSNVRHTGDYTGAIYGVWALESKNQGSFTQFDLKDVDVDGSQFSYSASRRQISFTKTLWLTQGLRYEMRLSGTYQVLEMTRRKLVIQKESMGFTTTYSFRRYK